MSDFYNINGKNNQVSTNPMENQNSNSFTNTNIEENVTQPQQTQPIDRYNPETIKLQAKQTQVEKQENFQTYGITLPQSEYEVLNKLIANSANPEEESYRLGTAYQYSKMYNIPIETAIENLDDYNRALYGEGTEKSAKEWYKAVGDAWKLGVNTMKQSDLGNKMLTAAKLGQDVLYQQYLEEYNALEQENLTLQDNAPRAWIVDALKAGMQSAPFTFTAAGAGIIGSLIAPGIGSFAAWNVSAAQAQGLEYADLIKSGADHEAASFVSSLSGALQGVVEVSLGNVPALKAATKVGGTTVTKAAGKLTEKLFKRLHYSGAFKTMGQTITNLGLSYGGEVVEEGLEEATQNIISEMGKHLTAVISEEYNLDEKTAGQIAKETMEAFKGGVLGSLVLGGLPLAVNANATYKEYDKVRKQAVTTQSREAFKADVKKDIADGKNHVFDNIAEDELDEVINNIYDNFSKERKQNFEESTIQEEDVKESRDLEEGSQEMEVDEEGERVGYTGEFRDDEGRLYLQNDTSYGKVEDGKTTGRLLVGDPTRPHSAEESGNRYGYIDYEQEGDTVTITSFKMSPGRENIAEDFYDDFAERFAGSKIVWEPKYETNLKLKQQIIRNNPNGIKEGLNYYQDTESVKGNRARIKLAKEFRQWLPNWNEEQTAAGVALAQAAANAKGISLEEYTKKYFQNGKMFASVEENAENLNQQERAEDGWKVMGAASFDDDGKAIIYVSKRADFNTFSHELAHVFRHTLEGEELQEAADAFKVADAAEWSRLEEEQFADGFVDYLRTGKAPTEGLRRLFAKAAKFIRDIIRGLQGTIDINPAITKVYDKLLKDDGTGYSQAIKAAEKAEKENIAKEKSIKYQQEQAEKELQEKAEEAEDSMTSTEVHNSDTLQDMEDDTVTDESLDTNEKAQTVIDTSGYERTQEIKEGPILFQLAKEDEEYFRAIEEGRIDDARNMVQEKASRNGYEDAIPEQAPGYKLRIKAAPKKTVKVYKTFYVDEQGRPSALFIDNSNPIPMNVWIDAKEAWHFTADNGREYVPTTKNPNRKTKSSGKTGTAVSIVNAPLEVKQELLKKGFIKKLTTKSVTAVAYRPGWHAGSVPIFPQGGKQGNPKTTPTGNPSKDYDPTKPTTNYENIHEWNQVVFEVEIDADYDYTEDAAKQPKAWSSEGKFMPKYADMQELPVDGFYKYTSNVTVDEMLHGKGKWYISDSMKIIRALSEEECNAILKENDILPQEWQSMEDKEKLGPMDLSKLGYTGPSFDAAKKTLAPITYDEEGNIIPLSQRFNKENPSILYQLEKDTKELKEEDVRKLYEGTDKWLKAPNGNTSNLSEKQWIQVRTTAFKKWFGDWETDPENASKVLDKNGEPLVVYHGTRTGGFDIFDNDKGNVQSDAPEGTYWFSSAAGNAKTYSGNYENASYEEERPGIYEVFLNIRQPALEDFEGATWDGIAYGKYALFTKDEDGEYNEQVYQDNGSSYFDSYEEAEIYAEENGIEDIYIQEDPFNEDVNSFVSNVLDWGDNDGVIIENVIDSGSYGEEEADDYIVFNPTQIKSATDNKGLFDKKNPSILYQLIGEKGIKELDKYYETSERNDNLKIAKEMQKTGKSPKEIKLATGWEYGADNKWKYELPKLEIKKTVVDEKAKGNIKKEYSLTDIIASDDIFRAYPELKEVTVIVDKLPKGTEGTYNKDEKTLYLSEDKVEEIINPAYHTPYFKIILSKEYQDFQDDLFSQDYTEEEFKAKEDKFYKTPMGKELYELENGLAAVKSFYNFESVKSIIAHELQHAIQDLEGFAPGGSYNTKSIMLEYWKNKKEIFNYSYNNFETELEILNGIYLASAYNKFVERPESFLKSGRSFEYRAFIYPKNKTERKQELLRDIDKMYKTELEKMDPLVRDITQSIVTKDKAQIREELKAQERKVEKLRKSSSVQKYEKAADSLKKYSNQLKWEFYENLAGEVESRNVEKRLNLSEEERKNSLLEDTADVPVEKQIPLNLLFQLADINEEAVRSKYEGTDKWLKAPNGKPTNLSEKQWIQVRTPSFKAWFGEWEADPENASKILDENGEPLVVYHGTDKRFTTFSLKKVSTPQFFFTNNLEAINNRGVGAARSGYVIPAFLNIRKPAGWHEEDNFGIEQIKARNFDGKILDDMGENTVYYIAFTPNQIKSATENTGAFDSSNPSILYQLIGEEGAENLDSYYETHSRIDNLNIAREMEEEGKDAKTIRLATGWEKGVDDKWRYELNDNNFHTVNENFYQKLFDDFNNKYPEVREADEYYIEGNTSKKPSQKAMQLWDRRDEIIKQKKESFYGDNVTLSDFIIDEELFNAYPELKDYGLKFYKFLDATRGGYFSQKDKEVVVFEADLENPGSEDRIKSVLLHEIQHAIQYIENFAIGGTPEFAESVIQNRINETKIRVDHELSELNNDYRSYLYYLSEKAALDFVKEIRELAKNPERITKTGYWQGHSWGVPSKKQNRAAYYDFIYDRLSSYILDTKESIQEAHGYKSRTAPNIVDKYLDYTPEEYEKEKKRVASDIRRVKKNAQRYIEIKDLGKDLYTQLEKGKVELYYLLAGEVEARNVQSRAYLSDEERRNKLIRDTEDRKRWDMITVFYQLANTIDELPLSPEDESRNMLQSLSVAKIQELEGISAEYIEKSTGWKKDNNKWKYSPETERDQALIEAYADNDITTRSNFDNAKNVLSLTKDVKEEDQDKMLPAQQVLFQKVYEGDAEETMLGVHNLSSDALRNAIRIGGLPNPSVAVIDVEKNPDFTNFGEITLLAPKTFIDKKTGKNTGTYGADIYSPRYPKANVDIEATSKGEKQIQELVKGIKDKSLRSHTAIGIERAIKSKTAPGSNYLAIVYLLNKGDDSFIVKEKNEFSDEEVKEVEDLNLGQFENIRDYPEKAVKFSEVYKKRAQTFKKYKDNPEMIEKLSKNFAEVTNPESIRYELLQHYISRVKNAVLQAGMINTTQTAEQAGVVVEEKYSDDFHNWSEEIVEDIDVKRTMYDDEKGKDIPLTLSNVSKLMRRENTRGGEGIQLTLGAVRALITPKFTTLPQIKKNRNRLVTTDAFNVIKEEGEEAFTRVKKILETGKGNKVTTKLIKAVMVDAPKNGIKEYLKTNFDIDITEEEAKEIENFREYLKQMPTEYFETKFTRPVYINEFEAALVPENLADKLKGYLSAQGLKLIQYNSESDRADKLMKLSSIMGENNNILFQTEAEMLKEAATFSNWEEWRDYYKVMWEGDLEAYAPEDADDAWYKSTYERAQEVQRLNTETPPEEPEAEQTTEEAPKRETKRQAKKKEEEVEDSQDEAWYAMITEEGELDNFLMTIAGIVYPNTTFIPADEEEMRYLDSMDFLRNRIETEMKHGSWTTAFQAARRDRNKELPNVELKPSHRKALTTLMRNNKRDYRDLYAAIMNKPEWDVRTGYTTSEELAAKVTKRKYNIESPDKQFSELTPEARRDFANALKNEDLKKLAKSGKMTMDNAHLQELIDGYEKDIKYLNRKIRLLKDDNTAKAEQYLAQRIELENALAELKEKQMLKAQAQGVRDLKVRLIKAINRKVNFKTVAYNEGKQIIAIQTLFHPALKKYVNKFINMEGPYIRDALSKYKTDYDYRRTLQTIAQNAPGSNRKLKKALEIMDNVSYDKWTQEERELVASVLPKTNWIEQLDLEELQKKRAGSLQLDLQSQETQELLKEALPENIHALLVAKDLRMWTLEEVEDLVAVVNDLFKKGRQDLYAKKEAAQLAAEAYIKEIMYAVEDSGVRFEKDDTPEEKEKKFKKIEKHMAKVLGQDNATKGTLKASAQRQGYLSKILNGYGDANIRRVARILDNGKEGINTTLLYYREDYCFNEEKRAIQKRTERMNRVLKENDISLDSLYETVTVNFPPYIRDPAVGEEIPATSMDFTVDELLYMEAASKDEMSYQAVACGNMFDETVKIHYRKNQASQDQYQEMAYARFEECLKVAAKLPENVRKLLKAIETDYDEQYDLMNKVSIEEYNQPVWRVEHYVPLTRLESNGDENANRQKEDLLAASGSYAKQFGWVDRGMTNKRIEISPANQRPVQLGLYSTWTESMQRTEHFIAYAGYLRDLNRVYKGRSSGAMRQEIENRYGRGMVGYIDQYINETANPNALQPKTQLDRIVRALRGKTAPAYLSWKMSSIIKQLCTSPWPYMQYVSPWKYAAAAIDFATKPELRDAIKSKSAYMNSRVYDPIVDIVNEEKAKATNKFKYKFTQFEAIGMKGLELVDWVCVAPGWLAVYREETARLSSDEEQNKLRDKARKMYSTYSDVQSEAWIQQQIENSILSSDQIEERAVRKADDVTRMCQPSSRLTDLSPIFKESNEIGKAFLQFTTSLNVIWQNIRYDLPNAVRNKQWQQVVGTIAGYTLAGLAVGLLTEGIDGEDDKEQQAGQIAFYAISQFTDSVPLVGSMISNTVESSLTKKWTFTSSNNLFPITTKAINGVKYITKEDWNKSAQNFAEAAGLSLGLPVSGVKEILTTVGVGHEEGFYPQAIVGRRPEK